MKSDFSIARTYLLFIGIFYLLIGMWGISEAVMDYIDSYASDSLYPFLTNFFSILEIGLPLTLLAFWLIVAPESILQIDYHGASDALPYLGVIAIVLGILSIISLKRAEKSIKWVFVWYFLSGLAFLIVIGDALYYLPVSSFEEIIEFSILPFINASLFLAATYVWHYRLLKKNQKPVL